MLDLLRVARSASLYRIKKPLTKKVIEALFRIVSSEKIGRFTTNIVRKSKTRSGRQIKYSLIIFKFEAEPSFLEDSNHLETKYAFLLLIEIDSYLAIIKKHVSGVEKQLKLNVERLEYQEVQYLFADQEVSYEKMSLANMGISRAGITRRTIESNDLKGQITGQSSRRAIPTSTTVRTRNHRHILRPASSSLSKADGKSDINDLIDWLAVITDEIGKKNLPNDFLDSFARPVDYKIVTSGVIKPNAILLNMSEILDKLEKGARLFLGKFPLSGQRLNRLFDIVATTLPIFDQNGSLLCFYGQDETSQKPVALIKLNKNSITLQSAWLTKLKVQDENGETYSLQKFINDRQLFTITFNSPEYIYIARKVFQDPGIGIHCKEISASIETFQFGQIASEKGENYTPTQVSFSTNSLFHFTESNLFIKDILICDDGGDEWADYIELSCSPPLVKLYHCKVGRVSTSASQLQIVVAQALKNIGRVSFNEGDINRKLNLWSNNFQNTQIPLIRTGHSHEEIKSTVKSIIESPGTSRSIAIVVPFLSKEEVTDAFDKISKQQSVRHHIPQLVWLLSSFTSTCKESGIQPRIICSP